MRFFKSPVKPAFLVLLFSLHVAAGCIHTWVAWHFFPNHGDMWYFFEESIAMKQQLLQHPLQFLDRIFSGGMFNITDTSKPLLDIQYQSLQYINVLLDLFSFNNFYINTLLFSFPVFAGTMALFKVFTVVFKNPLAPCCALLLPSVLFWTSVVYKDSLFYMAAGFFFYYLIIPVNAQIKKGVIILFSAALIFISRANALITLLPAAVFWLLTEKKCFGKRLSIVIIAAAIIILMFAFNAFTPGGILQAISVRQKDFQSLSGGSRIYLPLLEPSVYSLLSAFPVALANGLLQPLPGAGGKFIYTAFSIELLVIWSIILFACSRLFKKHLIRFGNFDYCCLLFALPGLVIIGYIVPFAGAIVRYRSIYLPFLLAPFINIICSYPPAIVQKLNTWLLHKVMVSEIDER